GHSLAEEENVDDDVRAGIGAETAFGQTNGSDQIGRLRNMLAGGTIQLVHGARAGDEGSKSAGLQEVEGPRNEVVVQPQTHRAIRPVGAHRAIREWRIADGEIEMRRQLCTGEVGIEDLRTWLQ